MGKAFTGAENINAADSQPAEELVLTPGGWRPKSQLHFLEPGHKISGKGGRLKIVEMATGHVVKDLGEKSVKNRFDKNADIMQPMTGIAPAPLPGPSPALPDIAWIEFSQWTNNTGNPIVYFSSKWVVPPAPSADDDQTIFLFNGLQQTSTGPYILQPVLQWGTSGAGGGKYWSIANWYVNGQGSHAITPAGGVIKVNAGDVLQGVMTLTGKSGTQYDYESTFVGYEDSKIVSGDIDELKWACETLECYGSDYTKPVPQCADYPNTDLTAFYEIEIKTGQTLATGTDAAITWDAVTSFTDCGQKAVVVSNDSPNGAVYLYYRDTAPALYFVVDKSTFGKDEVTDVVTHGNPPFANAFWLILEGYTAQQLSIDQPNPRAPVLSGAFKNLNGISISPGASGPEYELPGDLYTPQRIRFPFDIKFSTAGLNAFPTTGNTQELLTAAITINGTTLNAETVFELIAGADPYFTNVDPAQNNVFWLSQDLRVFTATPGKNNIPVPGGPAFSQDNVGGAFNYVQQLLTHLNANYSNTGGADPFNTVIPQQGGAFTGDSSVNPLTVDFSNIFVPKIYSNYNFALARVRLRGTAGAAGAAANVKVFFRLWSTQTADTDYQTGSTYPSVLDGSGLPASPQTGADHHTIPFFATGNLDSNSDYGAGGANNQQIEIQTGQDSVWCYFGCFLNLYDAGNIIDGQQVQHWLNGTHHCIVAQIAYDDAPIINSNGVTMNPENSDKLAQRNLQITISDNPGPPSTHRIPQTFDIRPSAALTGQAGSLLNYPDELMIDWGNIPVGSIAHIYWPQVNASRVLQLAAQLYGTHQLSAADANTIQCETTKGVTYVPVPDSTGENFAGLFTVDLPSSIIKGQEYNIIVRRVASRRQQDRYTGINQEATTTKPQKYFRNWRYITGTFQVKIPVSDKEGMLFPEENTLAIMKWRLQSMSPLSRWYPVLKKYIGYIAARIDGLGGNSTAIQPSLLGVPVKAKERGHDEQQHTGKICQVIFDCFGDFEGFILSTCSKEFSFKSREKGIAGVVLKACKERMLVTVCTGKNNPGKIIKIIVKC